MMPPYPPAASAASSSTSTSRPASRAAPATASANDGGRSSFGAVFTQSRLSRTAPATACARVISVCAPASAASGTAISTSATGSRRVGCGRVL